MAQGKLCFVNKERWQLGGVNGCMTEFVGGG